MKTLALSFVLAFILATGLSLLRLTDWWIRAFDFPRPQIAVLGIALLVVYVYVFDVRRLGEGALLVLLILCVVYQGWRMIPYTPLYPNQVAKAVNPLPGNTVSIMISNVYMKNRESGKLLELVQERSPDVLFLVETDAWWEEQFREVESDYPYSVKHPLPNTYGMILFSKLELLEPEVEFLFSKEIPSIYTRLRMSSGRIVHFHGLHPKPPSPTEAPNTIERDGELLVVARRVAERSGPSIVTGDLNDVAWSSTTSLMQRISGLLDPRIGRGLFSTFHAKIPILRWPLDHLFHSDHFQLVSLERLPAVGSDHFPVFVELALTPEAKAVQEAPKPENGDEERAEEKIEEAVEESEEEEPGEESPPSPERSGATGTLGG